ncbi:MAG: methylated-DNA--[protein]-cysteine S-methyltransferase [Acetobacteraceae bacterium]|nr:methylated-DNA--[protein]-cysteine S-methyltransferase [Acetobacteraceae bacterium]
MLTQVFRAGWGWAAVAVSPQGVRAVVLPRPTREEAQAGLDRELGACPRQAAASAPGPSPVLDAVRDALCRYLEGRRVEFPFPLDLSGFTPFQRKVLELTRTIPYGEVRSYGWLARGAGCPGGARAVGQVMRRNPVAIVVPCHRVVGSGGRLGGYSGGLGRKVQLLKLEGVEVSGGRVRVSKGREDR